jgi:hypothetical protein
MKAEGRRMKVFRPHPSSFGGRHGDAGRRRDGVVEQRAESLRPLKYAEAAEWVISALIELSDFSGSSTSP